MGGNYFEAFWDLGFLMFLRFNELKFVKLKI